MKKLIKKWLGLYELEQKVHELQAANTKHKYNLADNVAHIAIPSFKGVITGKVKNQLAYSVTDELGYTHLLDENELTLIEDEN